MPNDQPNSQPDNTPNSPISDPPATFSDKPPEKTTKKARKEAGELFGEKQMVLHSVFIYAIQFAAAVLGAVLLIRIYHMVAPFKWQWMCEDQLQALDKFLFSGVIGALIGRHFDSAFKQRE